jgi:hypothetical protein
LKAQFVSLQRLTLQAPMNRFCKLNLRISLAKADESTRAINKVRRRVVSQQVTNLRSERKAHFGESPRVRRIKLVLAGGQNQQAGSLCSPEFAAAIVATAYGTGSSVSR